MIQESWFADHTVRTVVLGTATIGAVSGTLGSFAYLRKQSLVGDVVAHSSLLGIVAAFFLSYLLTGTGSKDLAVLIPGALAGGIAALLLARGITTKTHIKEDCGLGVMLAIFFGTGILLLRYVQRRQPAIPGHSGIEDYLFGMAAALTANDLWMIGSLGALAVLAVLLLWRPLKVFTFDPGFAHSLGLPVRTLDTILLVLMVVGIVIGIHAVGVVLMIALLVTPASAARQWTTHLGGMVSLAAVFGAASGAAGSIFSAVVPRMPTGPVIVLFATGIFLVSLFCAPKRGVLARWQQRRRTLTADPA